MNPISGNAELETASSSLDTLCVTSARKRKRAYHRIMSGLHAPGAYKFLTLTSSPASPQDIQRSWRRLSMRLQRRGILTDGYIRITEYTHEGRPHYHILFRGGYLEQQWISHLWESIHQAPVVYITRMRSKRGISGYLAKYMAKDMQGRLSWSYPWLYQGFVKAWVILKRIGRDAGVDRSRVLTYWQRCCKLKRKPWEVQQWLAEQSTGKQRVAYVNGHSDVRPQGSLLRQSMLTGLKPTQTLLNAALRKA